MPNESEDLRIARERIAKEKKERTGFPDMKGIQLQSWPEELWELTPLQSLICSWNYLTTLEPLAGLTSLQTPDCSENRLTTLEPLAGLTSLQTLDCSENRLTTLEPLAGLTSLQDLNCWDNPLERLSEKLVWQESLLALIIPGAALEGIPAEVPSQNINDNCLERLRAWLRER